MHWFVIVRLLFHYRIWQNKVQWSSEVRAMNVLKCGAGAVVTLLTKYGHRGRWSTDRGTVCVCLCVCVVWYCKGREPGEKNEAVLLHWRRSMNLNTRVPFQYSRAPVAGIYFNQHVPDTSCVRSIKTQMENQTTTKTLLCHQIIKKRHFYEIMWNFHHFYNQWKVV